VSYIAPTERDPRGAIDLPRFAADLVKALNALDTNPAIECKLAPAGDYPNERQKIALDGSTELWVSADNWKKRVSVSIHAGDVPWDDRNTYNKDHHTESAKVNPDGRSIKTIARDIKRRVIDASAAALKLQRDHASAMAANRTSIKVRVAAFAKACPAVSITVHEREQNASLYYNSNGAYLSGTLSHDGSVRMRDVSGRLDGHKMAKLIALLSTQQPESK